MYYLIILLFLLILLHSFRNSYIYKWFSLAIKGPYFPGNRLDDSESDQE